MHAALNQFGLWLAPGQINAWARGLANGWPWLIPVLQGVHILAACAIVGAAGGLGFRALKGDSASLLQDAARRLVPWIWGALAVQLATGAFMVVHRPTRAFGSLMFPYKMMLIACGVALILLLARRVKAEGRDPRLIGAFAAAAWIGVVLAGRLISYIRAV